MLIKSSILPSSAIYKENYLYHEALCKELAERETRVRTSLLKTESSQTLIEQRNTPRSARERIALLIDEGTSLLELSTLAGYELYDGACAGGGIITGIGKVRGRDCMIVANNPEIKGGTYFPITVKKHLRAQEVALEQGLTCIYLVDSGGAFLPLQDEVFPDREHFGRIFYLQAQMSARGIPQIAAVLGSCTAGGAYVPAMSDYTVIVRNQGTIFLGGPPLVKAATGESVTAEDLGGALLHTSTSGVADYLAESDEDATRIVREIVSFLPEQQTQGEPPAVTSTLPRYDIDEILGVWPKDLRKQIDVREILARIVDESRFFEFKQRYATTLVCGHAYLGGLPCGIIANNGVLFGESALKATHFIQLCNRERTPLLFLQHISGFMVGAAYERAGIAKDGAKLVNAVATAEVPKITLIMGGSYGAGNYGMCGRAFSPRFLWTWPCSRISVMGGEQAAQVLLTIKEEQLAKRGEALSKEAAQAIGDPIRKKYETEGSPYHATARLWDDGILSMTQTRERLIESLRLVRFSAGTKHDFGIFRM
jgi:3-methylcrotonyl-CoA carboxylase beta subunit